MQHPILSGKSHMRSSAGVAIDLLNSKFTGLVNIGINQNYCYYLI